MCGGMGERFKPTLLKSVVGVTLPGVYAFAKRAAAQLRRTSRDTESLVRPYRQAGAKDVMAGNPSPASKCVGKRGVLL